MDYRNLDINTKIDLKGIISSEKYRNKQGVFCKDDTEFILLMLMKKLTNWETVINIFIDKYSFSD